MSDGRFIPFFFFVHAYIPCASSISFPFLVLICRSLTPHRCALLWLAENLFTEKTLFICANWAGPRAKSHTPTPTHRHSRLTVQLEQRRGKKRSGNLQREEKRRLYKWYVWFYRKARIFLQRTTMNFSYLNWETALCGGGGGGGVW